MVGRAVISTQTSGLDISFQDLIPDQAQVQQVIGQCVLDAQREAYQSVYPSPIQAEDDIQIRVDGDDVVIFFQELASQRGYNLTELQGEYTDNPQAFSKAGDEQAFGAWLTKRELEALLSDENCFEISLEEEGSPRFRHLHPGVFERTGDDLEMKAIYLPPDTYRNSWSWSDTSDQAHENGLRRVVAELGRGSSAGTP